MQHVEQAQRTHQDEFYAYYDGALDLRKPEPAAAAAGAGLQHHPPPSLPWQKDASALSSGMVPQSGPGGLTVSFVLDEYNTLPTSSASARIGCVALQNMDFLPTSLPDVLLVQPEILRDARGFFVETYRADAFAEAGIGSAFIQDNHSGSHRATLRGLHYQIRHSQGKLVRTVVGEIFDVAVDLRRSSPTFGCWVGTRLSSENRHMLWIPPGFAHGFYTLSDWAEVVYKATDYYAPQWERTLVWNDPEVGIAWPLIDGQQPILSDKDAAGIRLQEAETFS